MRIAPLQWDLRLTGAGLWVFALQMLLLDFEIMYPHLVLGGAWYLASLEVHYSTRFLAGLLVLLR